MQLVLSQIETKGLIMIISWLKIFILMILIMNNVCVCVFIVAL